MADVLDFMAIHPFLTAFLLLLIFTPVPLMFWRRWSPLSSPDKLKKLGKQLGKIEKENAVLAQTIDDLKTDMQKRMDSVEKSLTLMTGTLGEVKRETGDIDKHVDELENKTEVAANKVESIKHQVDVDLGELRRIDDQIKDSVIRVDQTARQIEYVAHEVRDLEREVNGGSGRRRRDSVPLS